MLCSSLLCAILLFTRILSHDILKMTPQRLDRRELVANLRDFFKRTVELVDILQDKLKTLSSRSVVSTSVSEQSKGHA